jgi:hypothetical protein
VHQAFEYAESNLIVFAFLASAAVPTWSSAYIPCFILSFCVVSCATNLIHTDYYISIPRILSVYDCRLRKNLATIYYLHAISSAAALSLYSCLCPCPSSTSCCTNATESS